MSYEYIRGLVEGEGCFTFCSAGVLMIPTFIIQMHERDTQLLVKMKNTLKLHNKVKVYKNRTRRDNYNRAPMARFMVRDIGQLKNIIVPLFYKKLHGYKGVQFEMWMERIGSDPRVPNRHKFIYKIYKAGFYDKNPKYE